MNNKKWKHLSTEVLFTHPRITIVEDSVQLPTGEIASYMKYGKTGNGITIICVKENKILLQREYSYPINKVIYQFPGGKIEKGELLEEAANRELIEESGLKPKSITDLGWYYVNNRRTDSKMYVVFTDDVEESLKIGGDLEENIMSEWISLNKFKKMIEKGEIVNFSVLAAWALYITKF